MEHGSPYEALHAYQWQCAPSYHPIMPNSTHDVVSIMLGLTMSVCGVEITIYEGYWGIPYMSPNYCNTCLGQCHSII